VDNEVQRLACTLAVRAAQSHLRKTRTTPFVAGLPSLTAGCTPPRECTHRTAQVADAPGLAGRDRSQQSLAALAGFDWVL